MQATDMTARALREAKAELAALEAEAIRFPRRLRLVARAGDRAQIRELQLRQKLTRRRLIAARGRVLQCRLAHLEAERAAAEAEVVAAADAVAAARGGDEDAARASGRLLEAIERVKVLDARHEEAARLRRARGGTPTGVAAGQPV